MSDLQCPAKIVLVAPEMLGPDASVPALGGTYSGVFLVSAVASRASELAARQPDHRHEILADVDDGASLARALQELADLHRGYTIVVVATREMIHELMDGRGDSTKPMVLAIDSSGWAVLDALECR